MARPVPAQLAALSGGASATKQYAGHANWHQGAGSHTGGTSRIAIWAPALLSGWRHPCWGEAVVGRRSVRPFSSGLGLI